MYIVLALIILFAFYVSYYLFANHRFGKNLHLVINKEYLTRLFDECDKPSSAAIGDNHEISIEKVEFIREDFIIDSRFKDALNHCPGVEHD